MTRTNQPTKRGTTRKTDTVATPKATRKTTRIDFDDTYLLQAIRTVPDTDRRAIVTTAKLMRMATTAKAGDVLRELGRELRETPALRADAMALGIILRGVAQAFDGAGQGGTE